MACGPPALRQGRLRLRRLGCYSDSERAMEISRRKFVGVASGGISSVPFCEGFVLNPSDIIVSRAGVHGRFDTLSNLMAEKVLLSNAFQEVASSVACGTFTIVGPEDDLNLEALEAARVQSADSSDRISVSEPSSFYFVRSYLGVPVPICYPETFDEGSVWQTIDCSLERQARHDAAQKLISQILLSRLHAINHRIQVIFRRFRTPQFLRQILAIQMPWHLLHGTHPPELAADNCLAVA